MVVVLHQRGFHDIYIYSGLSLSGINWRFCIGQIVDGKWSYKCFKMLNLFLVLSNVFLMIEVTSIPSMEVLC